MPKRKICMQCGAEVKIDEHNCPQCNSIEFRFRYDSKTCSGCEAELSLDIAECPICGSESFSLPFAENIDDVDPEEEDSNLSDSENEIKRCNHLTRNNTLCQVPIDNGNVCGYHKSKVQRRGEEALKATILQIFNETTGNNFELSEFPIGEDCPAHDLLKFIFDQFDKE